MFRAAVRQVLARLLSGEAAIVLVSAALFAAIHWGNGIGVMVLAFFAGIVLMALYRWSGSVVPPIVAHFCVNLWDFA